MLGHYQNAGTPCNFRCWLHHPVEQLRGQVFGVADRIAAYQDGPKNTLNAINWASNSGVQLNYSGALMEDVQNLAQAGQYYGANWYTHNQRPMAG